jgi:hypothetical protein
MSESRHNFHGIHSLGHSKLVFCQYGLAHRQVADEVDGLQIWRVAANILHKQLRTAIKVWSSSFGFGYGANNSPP